MPLLNLLRDSPAAVNEFTIEQAVAIAGEMVISGTTQIVLMNFVNIYHVSQVINCSSILIIAYLRRSAVVGLFYKTL